MNWEQKLMQIKALCGQAHLEMRRPGDWYVEDRIEISDGVMLVSPTTASVTPEAAVNELWEKYTLLKSTETLVVRRYGCRHEYRWNGWAFEEQCPRQVPEAG